MPDSQSAAAITIVEPAVSAEVAFYVGPADEQRFDVWIRCRDQWLDSLQRRSGWQNTRRAYQRDWTEFFAYWSNHRLMPWQVGSYHVEAWIKALYDRGLKDATVNRKLSSLASFYGYAGERFTLMTPAGERALWENANPFRRPMRAKVSPYGKAKGRIPSHDQVSLLLNQIDLCTTQGWRDLALLAGLFVTARRVSEWTHLKWGDLHDAEDGGKWFEYRYKGGESKRQAIPAGLWRIMEKYLKESGRLPLEDDDYLFIATCDTALRFRDANGRRTVRDDYDLAEQPLSNHRVNDLLKKYGRRAGIPDERLHAHALRHAGARARRRAGADLLELKDLLGHANVAITQVYTEDLLDEPEDTRGDDILAGVAPRQLRFALK